MKEFKWVTIIKFVVTIYCIKYKPTGQYYNHNDNEK